MKRTLLFLSLIATILLLALGCGGGGGGGTGTTGVPVRIFATDSLDTNYSHVWVTLYRVTLRGAAGLEGVAFDNPDGVVVDLKTLRDGTGSIFQLLGVQNISAGTYNSVEVVAGSSVNLVPVGGTTSETVSFPGSVGGRRTFTRPLVPEFTTATGDLVVDFDLANWEKVGSFIQSVTGYIRRGDDSGLGDRGRHRDCDLDGVVAQLSGTSPNLTFRLGRLTVETNEATVIFADDASANPNLANGNLVEVEGRFDTTRDVFIAREVKIRRSLGLPRPEAEGTITEVNPSAGTLVISISSSEGILPGGTTLNIATNGSTRFFLGRGRPVSAETFFAAAVTGREVEAKGSYEAGTLTARILKLEPGDDDDDDSDDETELRGTVTAFNAGEFTVNLRVNRWFGATLPPNTIVTANRGEGATFRLGNETVTATAFFAALSVGRTVEVEGRFEPEFNRITVQKFKLENSDDD